MKVLTIYAHHDPRSFCHGVLEHFTEGLRDAGHTSEVIDLYAIKFDPVFRARDMASYTADDISGDILELMDLRARVMNSCRGPVQRRLAARALRGKSPSGIAALIRSRMPKDVLAQQEKVAWADGLAFIAPIHFCSFPAILKGWIDRVWTLDFAYGLTSAGWHGDVNGRTRGRAEVAYCAAGAAIGPGGLRAGGYSTRSSAIPPRAQAGSRSSWREGRSSRRGACGCTSTAGPRRRPCSNSSPAGAPGPPQPTFAPATACWTP
jgi:putative NADPH-quinone reductase